MGAKEEQKQQDCFVFPTNMIMISVYRVLLRCGHCAEVCGGMIDTLNGICGTGFS